MVNNKKKTFHPPILINSFPGLTTAWLPQFISWYPHTCSLSALIPQTTNRPIRLPPRACGSYYPFFLAGIVPSVNTQTLRAPLCLKLWPSGALSRSPNCSKHSWCCSILQSLCYSLAYTLLHLTWSYFVCRQLCNSWLHLNTYNRIRCCSTHRRRHIWELLRNLFFLIAPPKYTKTQPPQE